MSGLESCFLKALPFISERMLPVIHSFCLGYVGTVTVRTTQLEHLPTHIDGTVVERVVKFLGVHITDKMNWSTHTDRVVKNVQQRLFNLKRLHYSSHMYILYSIPSTPSCHLYVIHVSLATLNNATFMCTSPTLLISYVYTVLYHYSFIYFYVHILHPFTRVCIR